MKRNTICGVPIDNVTIPEAMQIVTQMLLSSRPHAVFYANPETLARASQDAHFLSIMKHADFIFSDGIGLKLCGALVGAHFRERIAGIDLMIAMCSHAEKKGKSIFLLGGEKGVACETSEVLKEKFSKIIITGVSDGFAEAEQWEKNNAIRNSDIVFVAMGSPKQETWIQKNISDLPNAKIVMAVGGALDMLTGRTPRAPRIARQCGFEWLWRLSKEPIKRWRRVVSAVIMFPIYVITSHVTRKKQ